MIKYIVFSMLFLSQNLFCQTDSIKLIDEVNIDLSTQNNLSWENYNQKINIRPLIYSGNGFFNGKYYKNGQEIIFEGKVNHKKNGIVVKSSNSLQDKSIETIIEKLITEVFKLSNFYYFRSNKKGNKPYEEFAIQREDNTWVFNTYKEDIKKENHIENKKAKREVLLDNDGKIKRITTSLTHNDNAVSTQKQFQDHYIEIDIISSEIKQKYSKIKGEILDINSKNKIEFSIVFP